MDKQESESSIDTDVISLAETLREVGTVAVAAGHALRLLVECVPDSLWELLEDEMKRRDNK